MEEWNSYPVQEVYPQPQFHCKGMEGERWNCCASRGKIKREEPRPGEFPFPSGEERESQAPRIGREWGAGKGRKLETCRGGEFLHLNEKGGAGKEEREAEEEVWNCGEGR